MSAGRFMLVLHSHMPYVLSHGKSPHGTDWLFESAAECYLPILDALDRLRLQGIKPRWTINLTPILGEQLDDPSFKSGFEDYCQEKIDYAVSDQARFDKTSELKMVGIAAMWQRVYSRALMQFKHQWGRSITGALREFQEDGLIELITCGATHGYFPLLGTDESVQAQVKLAVSSHVKRFGTKPRGIWLPECAYRPAYDWKAPVGEGETPWPRKAVDDFVRENGIEYFFVDSHLIRGGEPLGTYWQKFPQLAEMFERSRHLFTPPAEARSEYEHYSLAGGTVVMARDPETTVKVWSGDIGYPGDEYYLEFHKQLYPGRLRYWRISQNKADLGAKQPYDPWVAYDRIHGHARDFVSLVKSTLSRYRGQANREGTVVAMYDTELFGHWWWEGPEFLYESALEMHRDGSIEMVSGGDLIDQEPPRHRISLPEGSWGEGGYHSVWLNEDNIWTWKELYPCQRRMREMAAALAGGPAHEIVEQCARELLLAEASDWQFLISTWAARDYAEARFADHIERFNRLADLASTVDQGHDMTAEEREFLLDCQEKDACFAELDLGYWAKLDHPLSLSGVPSS
jgi:1,4-alpha-glucan branching enzyme